jgi:hypothetical protein
VKATSPGIGRGAGARAGSGGGGWSRLREPSPQMLERAATDFRTLRDGFLEWYYEVNPSDRASSGSGPMTTRLPAMDRVSLQRRIDALLDWESELTGISLTLLREGDRLDYAMMEFGIRAELLELEELRRWALDPVAYTAA